MTKPALKPVWDFLNTSRLVRYLLFFALGWAIIEVLAYFETIVVVFTFATILAFFLNYPVRWLERYTQHAFAVIVVFLLSLIISAILGATLGLTVFSELQELLRQAPDLVQSFLPFFNQLETWLERSNIPLDLNFLQTGLQTQLVNLLNLVTDFAGGILANFLDLIIILVIAFFMLLDGQKLWQYLVQLFPESIQSDLTTSLRDNFLGFFRGRLILSIFFGVSAFFIFLLMQTPYPLLLATIAGLFDLIPGIGATIGVFLIAIILLPQGILVSLQVIIYCVVLQQIEENVLMPRIMQNSVNLNPVVIFFALLVGTRVAGFLGLVLAIPIAAVIVSLFNVEALKG